MNDSAHILVVDDEPDARSELEDYLTYNGYRVSTAEGGPTMRDVLENQGVDLVILDLMMPGEDGLTLTDYLRKRSDVGIIILTGKPDSVDQIVGLELGADDYLSKPCDLRQMLARVRSVLRRRQMAAEAESGSKQVSGDAVLAFEGFTIHTSRRHLSDAGGEDIPLTTAEYDLLLAFVENAGGALTRDILLDITRSRELSPFDRSIDILVSRLRKKLEPDSKQPEVIKTIRGIGYMFTPQVTKT